MVSPEPSEPCLAEPGPELGMVSPEPCPEPCLPDLVRMVISDAYAPNDCQKSDLEAGASASGRETVSLRTSLGVSRRKRKLCLNS
jgi:hypothetical protein